MIEQTKRNAAIIFFLIIIIIKNLLYILWFLTLSVRNLLFNFNNATTKRFFFFFTYLKFLTGSFIFHRVELTRHFFFSFSCVFSRKLIFLRSLNLWNSLLSVNYSYRLYNLWRSIKKVLFFWCWIFFKWSMPVGNFFNFISCTTVHHRNRRMYTRCSLQ